MYFLQIHQSEMMFLFFRIGIIEVQ
jgi:hypothetical protein